MMKNWRAWVELETGDHKGWRYNIVLGVALVLLVAWSPNTRPGLLVQIMLLPLAAYVFAQAGMLETIEAARVIAKIPRAGLWAPPIAAVICAGVTLTTDGIWPTFMAALMVGLDSFIFGRFWEQEQARKASRDRG